MSAKKKKSDTQRYINRELSWIEFNQRVLDEALDDSVPLLERVMFLAITSRNLDEFYMVRVGGLHLMCAARKTSKDISGMTPLQQLKQVRRRLQKMADDQYTCYLEKLVPALAEEGIRRRTYGELESYQSEYIDRLFYDEVYPTVTPMVLEGGARMPLLQNGVVYVAARLKSDSRDKPQVITALPLSRTVSRMISLPGEKGHEFIFQEDVLTTFIDHFFPGEKVLETVVLRVTRNADIAVQDEIAPNLVKEIEDVLTARNFSSVVRLKIENTVSRTMLGRLQKMLGVSAEDVISVPSPVHLGDLESLAFQTGYQRLRYPQWPPQSHPDISVDESMFDVIADKDLLLHHPYQSFDPIVRFIEEAAEDPGVLAIKQILYRTSSSSPIVDALIRAAKNGKNVTVLVELKARFDEARNVTRARELEQAGAQVIYGVRNLKTHAKICIVIRREQRGIRRYMHFGTGNYNESTARIYGDVSLLTCHDEFGTDASVFFNTICGLSQPQKFRRIDMAPVGLKSRILAMIHSEIDRKKQGGKALIMAKVNSLADPEVIDALYEASKAGVKIQLNVRGICCLRPGVPKLSENITVVSIIDRFLEHSRILYFYHGGTPKVYISSADWMPRNLDRRIELLVPVEDKDCRNQLISYLKIYFKDNVKAREILENGSYELIKPKNNRSTIRSQKVLYEDACQKLEDKEKSRPVVFEPHRPKAK